MTIIEVLIAISILGIMMLAFTSIYSVGLSRLRDELVQTQLQSEAQVLLDRISTEVTQAQGVEQVYDGVNLSASYLPLKIPAINSSQNIIYNNNSNIIYDHIVYKINGSNLTRMVVADTGSKRYGENNIEKTLSTSVTNLTFTYAPDNVSPTQINISISLSKKAGNRTRTITLQGGAKFRNNL